MIYEIKQAAFDAGLAPSKDKLVRLIASFSQVVGGNGRSNEFTVMRKTIGMNVGEAYDSLPLGFKLLLRGRIGLSAERIKARKEIRQITLGA